MFSSKAVIGGIIIAAAGASAIGIGLSSSSHSESETSESSFSTVVSGKDLTLLKPSDLPTIKPGVDSSLIPRTEVSDTIKQKYQEEQRNK